MTGPRRPLTTAAALALVLLPVAGCSDGTTPSAPSPTSATAKPTGTPSPSGGGEEEQGKRAKAALETVSPDDPEFVESGLERVSDGVHGISPLGKGKSYKISVACVGTGTLKVAIADKTPLSVPCDGVPFHQRVDHSPARLPLDITAASGATGMVAWQIVSVSS
ncbi:hypothetical protein [Streptomyces termitum]|uniref:hypothetical protein n=1 Tax=Streptomyces termitum TaxID=67368 RepID=UPI00378BC588